MAPPRQQKDHPHSEEAPADAEQDRTSGRVDNILKVHSLHPETLRAHVDLYRTVMYGRSMITRPEREMIGVVVSAINRCAY